MSKKSTTSEQVTPDNPFDLVITDDGLVSYLHGHPVTMEEYRAYYAERTKNYKYKY